MEDQKAQGLEGVEGKLKNLKLSEAERKSIKIGRKQVGASSTGKLQVVGKILSDRPARAEFVKKSLGDFWNPFTGVECKDMARNRFLFTFHDQESKSKALNNGPWDFNGKLVVMENFMPNKTIDEYEFKYIPIWVRASGIPMGMMNMDTSKLVGEQIGEFITADLDENGDAMGEYLRIKIKMDITAPLMRFTILEIEDEEEGMTEEKIVTLKYEYLPEFCYRCGIIGHTENFCSLKEGNEGKRQYGPWLRAVIVRGSPRSSSEKSKFWLSNSAGSRESRQTIEGPSWRKEAHGQENQGKGKEIEQKETMKQSESIKENLNSVDEGKIITPEGELQVDKLNKVQSKDQTEEEDLKREGYSNLHKSSNLFRDKEIPKEEEGKSKQRTYKRFRKTNYKTQEIQGKESDSIVKKRNANLMEIDDEIFNIKKARMEIDKEDNTDTEKEDDEQIKHENAGLQRQPGETK